jgi:hypothetical protein
MTSAARGDHTASDSPWPTTNTTRMDRERLKLDKDNVGLLGDVTPPAASHGKRQEL